MSKRRNETNRSMSRIGLNRYKLGKRKPPVLGAQSGNQVKIHYHYNTADGKYQVETEVVS